MRYAGLGVQLAVSLLVFVLVGQWADRKLGTNGIVTMVAAFVGFGGTMYSLIRTLNRQDASSQDRGANTGTAEGGGGQAGGRESAGDEGGSGKGAGAE